ncbi:tail fiber assembly protein [Pantoea agglomerans]|uniref:tail fiber assembly protein n=1 Tax=Enterobacter agglomerans TaxID=549 RepID=UPI003C7EBE84
MSKVTLDKNGLAKSAGTLTVYNFDAVSGEFTGSNDEYLAQGVGLPANACITAPPAAEAGSVALYLNGSWQVIADHRGETVYSVNDGSAVLITVPGDYPADTTPLKPATIWDQWDGEKWVTDTDAQRKAEVSRVATEKSALINEANGITQAWQTQLLLGIITDSDKALLTAWMRYLQTIQNIDITEPKSIIWPGKPE